ncbi:hypothetical protein HMPREF9451_00459 [Slackia piriformis YIT 12062]|uniref:Uncharacterized protein n=1 Tax=Slackia piriformis YIT 12062 TaxID=742818 RepID=K0ZBK6_9ACTN|nr:hypothetical protein HMPREF9451_00459 [Slackia piriformis YIT 12062]
MKRIRLAFAMQIVSFDSLSRSSLSMWSIPFCWKVLSVILIDGTCDRAFCVYILYEIEQFVA